MSYWKGYQCQKTACWKKCLIIRYTSTARYSTSRWFLLLCDELCYQLWRMQSECAIVHYYWMCFSLSAYLLFTYSAWFNYSICPGDYMHVCTYFWMALLCSFHCGYTVLNVTIQVSSCLGHLCVYCKGASVWQESEFRTSKQYGKAHEYVAGIQYPAMFF